MNNKPEIVFTFPAAMGGVASFNFNIINHSTLIKKFRSKVILLQAEEDKRPVFKDSFNVDVCTTFRYSFKENQYHVMKRLALLIGSNEGAVVCDNGITIQACSVFNLKKTIFHLVHDYFYVNQNIALGKMIDIAVAHSSFFADCVFASNPSEFNNRCFYIPYGVRQQADFREKQPEGLLNLFFLGRLDKGKGVDKLIEIERLLSERGTHTKWTIIGKGPLEKKLKEDWRHNNNIQFEQPDTTEKVYEILSKQDIFVFPTEFEGTPVSIMEAMSNGNVTVVSDLPGGIRDMVGYDEGFRVNFGNIESFCAAIELLENDRVRLRKMQQRALEKAKVSFDVKVNADKYFDLFSQFQAYKRLTKSKTIHLSRLDKSYIPNAFVKLIRNLRN